MNKHTVITGQLSKMDNDKIIAECITILLSTFNNYCKRPTWEKLQVMFRQTLLLGIELGKKQVYINQSIKGELEQ